MDRTYGLYLVFSYLVGAIPFGWLIAKSRGVNIRTYGSRSIGATNVGSALGMPYFFLTLALDGLKGFLPTLLAVRWYGLTPAIPVALLTMVGHSFPIYLGFRGGKGVATGAGAFLALFPKGMAIAVLTWGILLLLTRIMAVASLGGALALGVSALYLSPTPYLTGVIWAGVILVFIRHRHNIRRLLRGEEPRIGRRER